MADDPNRPTRIDDLPDEGEQVENAMDFIDTENNEGELAIALGHIRRLMEDQGWSYERAVQVYGIRGHPCFKDIGRPTTWWETQGGHARERFYRSPIRTQADDRTFHGQPGSDRLALRECWALEGRSFDALYAYGARDTTSTHLGMGVPSQSRYS